jgi:hypothetical protein
MTNIADLLAGAIFGSLLLFYAVLLVVALKEARE